MSAEQAAAFAIFAAVAAGTPGPSNVMLTATGAIAGIGRGLPCLFGVAAGMAAMLLVVALGLGTVVLGHPAAVLALNTAGAAFLLWLAWKIATAPVGDKVEGGRPVGFAGAFAFQWLNPKSWLVATSASATYLDPGGAVFAQSVAIGALFGAIALATGFLWLAFGVALQRFLARPAFQRAFNVAMGSTLALSVLALISAP